MNAMESKRKSTLVFVSSVMGAPHAESSGQARSRVSLVIQLVFTPN